ncbi:hypothetical protein AB0M28_32945 [Streptomyces sp. NPDC051940]|uniref:hypothetical protein n=1 Tax=Streptomyces sp. NPDC051940 TaxID=3155675 RepID=UPI0034278875
MRPTLEPSVNGAAAPGTTASRAPAGPGQRPVPAPGAGIQRAWLRNQSVNVARHAAALRPFRRGEFGTGDAAPSEGHLQAVNQLLQTLRRSMLRVGTEVTRAHQAAARRPATAELQRLTVAKERAHDWVRAVERVWDFYFELFGQRQSEVAPWLLAADRIALDCYQVSFMRLGTAKSIPAPPPFAYMRTGFSPATFRRQIPLRRLGQQLNPFPLVQLPYHRLVNPWTLGAILHEVSHNLHNDLGLERVVPRRIHARLRAAGFSEAVARTWTRWNRELFADVCGLLLGGPAVVGSLFDVIGRSPATVLAYGPNAPHPTPYLRAFISLELLRRMGFTDEAAAYRRLWTRMYPAPGAGTIPRELLATFPEANRVVVDAVCFRRFAALGGKALCEVLPFAAKEQQIVEEAAGRLAAGTDPGIIPERLVIGAARVALDRRLARPEVVSRNFYTALARS